ncbi:MAG TPA: HAMP domain-containing sensor histidine kinase [Gemmatimonadaceae bacterium]|nr:HAMP domain-containing sensor histidine kinase [Gemmatimonadaceae bacterium]
MPIAATRARRAAPVDLSEAELRSVSEVVHDLRSPLASIMLLSDALSQRLGGRDDVGHRQAELIRGAALAMHELVSDLRDLARGTNALMDPAPIPFSLADMMTTIWSLVRPLAEEKGLALRAVIPEHTTALGHPTALTRVLLNLVTNSLKFTDAGYVEVAATALPGGGARFTVRDTGAGLPERITALVTGESVRGAADRAKVSGEFGVGLGLSLCMRLVKQMRGSMRLDPTVTRGTCFVIDLPMTITGDGPWPAVPRIIAGGPAADTAR